jgi:adenosylhomocysteine nucleosidase
MAELHLIVLISANSEWATVKENLAPIKIKSTPLGETFDVTLVSPAQSGDKVWNVTFFHGGWGKISAAATAQYVIDQFQPDLLINLGTCGGFEGCIARGTIILVEKTIVYDILEQMFDLDGSISHYSTELDLSWLQEPYPHPVQRGLLVSADRDIIASDIPMLVEKYAAVAADWESGAIAWVAKRNGVRCLILRGVTDLVGASGGEAYGNIEIFRENAKIVMKELIEQLPDWLNNICLETPAQTPLFSKVDCIRLYVTDLENGLSFYRDRLGHQLIWRTTQAAGLRMPDSDAGIVIQTEEKGMEVDIIVESADKAAQRFVEAGGVVLVPLFDIQIGHCCVVRDPWGNQLVLLDASKGLLVTDEEGNVIN